MNFEMNLSKYFLYDWSGDNVGLFKLINGSFSGVYYDKAMEYITMLGDKKLLPFFLLIIAGYALLSLLWRIIARKGGGKHCFLMWVGIAMIVVSGFITTNTTVFMLKHHFEYPRPYAVLAASEVRHVEVRAEEDANRGFPSGHVAIITTLIMALWPALSSKFRWFGVGLIFAVAWSRIALGVHFPADVLASILICTFEIVLIRWILYGFFRRLFGIVF